MGQFFERLLTYVKTCWSTWNVIPDLERLGAIHENMCVYDCIPGSLGKDRGVPHAQNLTGARLRLQHFASPDRLEDKALRNIP